MAIVVATAQTVIKNGDRKVNIKVGESLGGTVFPGKGQEVSIKLAGDIAKYSAKADEYWSLYSPHWDMGKVISAGAIASPKNIRLNVPYFAQCDTRFDGYRYCNSHANCMVAAFLLGESFYKAARGYAQPEQYYIAGLDGDTTDSDVQTRRLRSLGIESYWSTSLSPADIYESLSKGVPIAIGLAYKGSGHIVAIVGIENGNYLIHDSYGVRSGTADFYARTSTDQDKLGAFDTYTPAAMDALFWDMRSNVSRECGWGRIVTSVRGVPTGLKAGL